VTYFHRSEFLEEISKRTGTVRFSMLLAFANSDQARCSIRSLPLTLSPALFSFNSAAENGSFFFWLRWVLLSSRRDV
jgi:hypothetical protein